MARADHQLLFGLIALQVGLIDQAQLGAAFRAWALDKTRPLADHLVICGDLGADGRAAVEVMVALKLKEHGGDAGKCLGSIPVDDATCEILARLRAVEVALGIPASAGQRFRILRRYAVGGLGVVSVAFDAELQREVALKQIQPRQADDTDSRARFVLEAEVTGRLEHPGIVPVYGLGTDDEGRPFYAMRFVRGIGFDKAIRDFHQADEDPSRNPEERSLALRHLLGRFVDICHTVAYAHSRGVLHRDLKPGNILLGPFNESLVMDWGLAKVYARAPGGPPGRPQAEPAPSAGPPSEPTGAPAAGENGAGARAGDVAAAASSKWIGPEPEAGFSEPLLGSSSSTDTPEGTLMGTPAFMSPEQVQGQLDQLGPASDVYSLGVTLYILLSGRMPFVAHNFRALQGRVRLSEFPPPRKVNPRVPRALEAVCLKAMQNRPADRYASAAELAADIERWLADAPVSAYREPLSERLARWGRRHKPIVARRARPADHSRGRAVGGDRLHRPRAGQDTGAVIEMASADAERPLRGLIEQCPGPAPARQLLFGLIALQVGLVDQAQLGAAFRAWVLDKTRPLADHLVTCGDLGADGRAAVEVMVALKLKEHGGDAGKCLGSIPVDHAICEILARIRNHDVEDVLAHVDSGSAARPTATSTSWPIATSLRTLDYTDYDVHLTADREIAEPTVGWDMRVPTSVGMRFQILQPHAVGGLGVVSVAFDAELQREVALKQIKPERADDEYSRARFLLEAEVTGRLEHPGIVPVYGLGTDDEGRPFYAMRFVRGISLDEAIRDFHQADEDPRRDPGERSLALRHLLGRFVEICQTIAYAHSRGVAHRDLKPANVLLGPFNETLVVDWGLAKVYARGPGGPQEESAAPEEPPLEPAKLTPRPELPLSPTLTGGYSGFWPSAESGGSAPGTPEHPSSARRDLALGTPSYMSPEQAEGDLDRVGPMSDVYSLGATLYHLLTGWPPFLGDDVHAVLGAVRRGDFLPLRAFDPSIDPALEAVCLKAMALEPRDRYASARALVEDIERWMAGEPVAAWPRVRRLSLRRFWPGLFSAAGASVNGTS
jgi:serine/threonine protein kinase